MASVSSIAMWFAKNSGSIEIIWLGWEITTSLSFFILASFISIFTLLIIFFFVKKIVLLPIKIKQNLEQLRIKQSMTALEEGLLAAAYDEKEKVLLSYNKAKKYIKESPLYLLLELQNYIIKGNDAQCFSTYKKMLEFSASRPLAINGLISIANKNCDPELFSNMLNYASKYKVHLEFFIFEAIKFCIKNSDWNILKNYTNKSTEKLNNKVKNAISFLNFNLAKISLENNKTEEAKILLEEIFNSKIYFPSYVELYCNLNLQKNEKKLKKILKASWKHFLIKVYLILF